MNAPKRKRLGDLLIEHNLITKSQLEEALKAQVTYGGKLGTNLIELGYIGETTLTNFLSNQLNIPAAKPENFNDIPKEVIDCIPKDFAAEHKIVPLSKSGKRLKVAISDPFDIKSVDDLAFQTSQVIDRLIAPEILIVYALETYYGIPREARYVKLSGVTQEEMKLTETVAETVDMSFVDTADQSGEHPFPLEKMALELANADSKEQIFNILLRYFDYYYKNLGVFIIRGPILQGFVTQGYEIGKDNFRKMQLPLDKESIFSHVAETQSIYCGDIPGGGINDLAVATLKLKNRNSCLIPLLLNTKTASILMCNEYKFEDTKPPMKDFDTVAKKISYAFQIQFLKKRILTPNM